MQRQDWSPLVIPTKQETALKQQLMRGMQSETVGWARCLIRGALAQGNAGYQESSLRVARSHQDLPSQSSLLH